MPTAARVREDVIPSIDVEGELWRVVLRMRTGRIHRQLYMSQRSWLTTVTFCTIEMEITRTHQGGGGMWKRDQHLFFFFQSSA